MKRYPFMKHSSLAASASALGLALAMSPMAAAQAAELQVLAGGGIAGPMRELASQFETASGHKLVIRFGTTPELIKMATGGPFDLAVVPREVFKDTGAQAQFVSPPNITIARVGLGVAVRAGAPRPDISTPEALKQALLKAQSIATTPASAAGAQVMRAFDALGVGDAIKAKIKPQPGPAQIVEAVAKGDAELGIFLINTITAPGLDVVGPFPAELQQEIVFDAAVAANSKDAQAAKAFISFLQTPAAIMVIKAKGMNPG
ncbi:MAG: molybdate transporter, periplasmic molybdate-binding protein [Ramlibacter sp.]|jgi:molybdate transport system substrate-binding protein|nr:molybdate transporter, periplasmic molybdate-binding protein [Ramlibacter sp.]